MDASVQPDSGFAVVALVLGLASLLPFYGIAAAPFAVFFGLLGRRRHPGMGSAGLTLGILGCVENALVLLFFVF